MLGAAGVELSVEPGEICVLMGLSGSGKSTILRAVNGLNKVARGRVLVQDGERQIDVAHCSAAELRALRTQPHRHGVPAIRAAALAHRERECRARAWSCAAPSKAEIDRVVNEKLALVGLSQWGGKFGHELSGGMQQRVGLARAFATDADILLMDEPFSALDPLIRDKLQDELLALQKDMRKTIIFVSHDLDEAMKLGNRIAILEGGRVVQWGTAEEILLQPANDYVAEFVKHMNPLNVLRGAAMMTPAATLAREGSDVLLDKRGRIRIALDEEGPSAGPARSTARRARWSAPRRRPGAESRVPPTSSSRRSISKMRMAIELRRMSGNPIVLVDQLGRMAGLCGDDEIYRALLRARRTSSGAKDRGRASLRRRCERSEAIYISAIVSQSRRAATPRRWIASALRSSR